MHSRTGLLGGQHDGQTQSLTIDRPMNVLEAVYRSNRPAGACVQLCTRHVDMANTLYAMTVERKVGHRRISKLKYQSQIFFI